MSRKIEPHYGGNPLNVIEAPNIGVLFAFGTSTPQNGSSGYAPGCIFIHVGDDMNKVYINKGTNTNSNFQAVSTQ